MVSQFPCNLVLSVCYFTVVGILKSQNCRAVFSMCLHVRSLPRRNPLSKDEKTPCRMTRQSLQSVLFPCLVSQMFCIIHLSRDLVSMILPFRFVKIIDYFMTNRILNTWRDLQVWQARNFYTLLYANGFQTIAGEEVGSSFFGGWRLRLVSPLISTWQLSVCLNCFGHLRAAKDFKVICITMAAAATTVTSIDRKAHCPISKSPIVVLGP